MPHVAMPSQSLAAAAPSASSPCASPETPTRLELQSLLDRPHAASGPTTVASPHESAQHADDALAVPAAALRAQKAANLQLLLQHREHAAAVPLLLCTPDEGMQESPLDVEDGHGHMSTGSIVAPSVQQTTTNRLLGVMSVLLVALLFLAGGLVWLAASDQSDEQISDLALWLQQQQAALREHKQQMMHHQRQQEALLQQQGKQMQNQQLAIVAGLASLTNITAAALPKHESQQSQQRLQPQQQVATSPTALRSVIVLPEYRLTVVYFAHLMIGWEGILHEQLSTLSNIGLGDAAEVHVVLSAPAGSFDQLDEAAENLLAAGEKLAKSILPECAVHLHAGNRYEYPGIRHLWDLGQHSTHEPSKHFFLYFHAKGIVRGTSGLRHQLMNTTVVPWRAITARFIEDPELLKQGHMTSLQGFMWYNFYWLRGSYLHDLMPPMLNLTDRSSRYYNEGWSSYLRVGSTLAGACTTQCNWPAGARAGRHMINPVQQVFPCFGRGIDAGTGSLVGCHSGPSASRATCGDAHWTRGEAVAPGLRCDSTPMLKDQPDAKQFTGDTRGRVRLVALHDD